MLRPVDLAAGAPDEPDALRRAERLFDAAAQTGLDLTRLGEAGAKIATLACQAAPYLATLLARDPTRLIRVAHDPYLLREKPLEVLAAEVVAAIAPTATPEELRAALRRIRGDELVRLGARELELGLHSEVGRELSRLADTVFDAAISRCDRDLRERYGDPRYVDEHGIEHDASLAVIAMGKLGGEELNFASDVDVIYAYSSDQGEVGGLSLHEYFAKLCTQVTATLSEVTEDDIVFRVDLRLRPEGSKGAIANSVAQLERYYETFGRPWERQAWIKARACAGDLALGAEIIGMLRPFVFPRLVSATVLDDVRDLNRRIKRELVRPRRAGSAGDHLVSQAAGFDLKNGAGGIREIEFFVQALQLIHAGKRPQLRIRGTLAALDALLFAGLVTDDEHAELWRAYRWLRHAEHVLQLEAGLQTQTIPDDAELIERFARRLRYPDTAALERGLVEHATAVSRLFATLGVPSDGPADVGAVLGGELSQADERAALERLGFADATTAQAELARARRNAGAPLSPNADERMARVGAALLGEIAASADPDQALRFAVELIAHRRSNWTIWRLLDEQPAICRLLGSLLGASAYLARTLIDMPELIDLLVELGQTSPRRTAAQVEADLSKRLAAADPTDPETVWSAVAEAKNSHVLRVGLADFAGALDPLEVCTELTTIAEVCLVQALAIVEAQLAERHGRPRGDAQLAVLGMGKLGGRELGYAADLDVIFVFTTSSSDDELSDGEAPLTPIEWFTRCAQRLLGALRQRTRRGRLYEVDTRLRPSGSQGTLITSLTGWQRYHAERARLWERQALTKLRPIAGDGALGAEVARLAAETVYGPGVGDPHAMADEIMAMRDRIDRELGGHDDLKKGAGGIMDVEFAAQYLQLVHGHAHPELRTTSTVTALRAAGGLGLAPAREVELLVAGYRFLRTIEHRIRVVHDQPLHRLPSARDELDKLARRSGFPDGGILLEHVERWQREVRGAYERVLGA